MKPAKIIYFVSGHHPTSEQFEEAAEIRGHVVFRNAHKVPAGGALEECDGVAGDVPQVYADKYPGHEEAIEKHAAKLKAQRERIGDEPAPEVKTAAPPAAGGKTWGGKPAETK